MEYVYQARVTRVHAAKRITLPVPPSANTAYPSNQHGGGRHLSKAGREYKELAGWTVKSALQGWRIEAGDYLTFDIGLWFKNERRCDVDSYVKLVKDIVCEVLGVDDNWKIVPRINVEFRGLDKDNPRCELMLTHYKTA